MQQNTKFIYLDTVLVIFKASSLNGLAYKR